MNCENCENKIKEGLKFCTQCGKKIVTSSQNEVLPNNEVNTQRRSVWQIVYKIIIPIIVAISVVIATLIWIDWIEDNKKQDAAMEKLRQTIIERELREFELSKKNVQLFTNQSEEIDNIVFSELTTTDHGITAPERFLSLSQRLSKIDYETSGRFVSISFLVTNKTGITQNLTSENFVIHDLNNRSFTAFSDRTACGVLKPNISCRVEILFETEPDFIFNKISFDYLISRQ